MYILDNNDTIVENLVKQYNFKYKLAEDKDKIIRSFYLKHVFSVFIMIIIVAAIGYGSYSVAMKNDVINSVVIAGIDLIVCIVFALILMVHNKPSTLYKEAYDKFDNIKNKKPLNI